MADDQTLAPAADLYEADFYLWTQDQAAALAREGRAGRLPSGLDWTRLAEEVGDLGKRDLKAAMSLVARIIEHLILLAASRQDQPKAHWRREVRTFRSDLELELTGAIRNKIEASLPRLHEKAVAAMRAYLAEIDPAALPLDMGRRWSLGQILGETDDPLDAD